MINKLGFALVGAGLALLAAPADLAVAQDDPWFDVSRPRRPIKTADSDQPSRTTIHIPERPTEAHAPGDFAHSQDEPEAPSQDEPEDEMMAETTDTVLEVDDAPGWQKPLPLSLSLEYTLVSDYIFRGINFSEHATEGRETPNHQLGTSISLDLAPLFGAESGKYGEIGFDTWFEWYGDQRKISGDGANIQEIDYTIWYSYSVEPIATDFTIGWIDYIFPNVRGTNDDRTNEWFISIAHNDAWMWRWIGYEGEDGILNPSLDVYHDLHISGGVWADFGVSHGFELIDNLTLTPAYTLHIDGGWAGPLLKLDDHDTRLAGMTWGLDVTYDMTELMHLPDWAGSVSLSGFLNYFNPTSRFRSTLGFEDQLFGGMRVAWSW